MNGRGDTSPPRLLRIDIEGGIAFEMDSGEDSLLRGALRAGVTFPYECSVGGCGSCRFELLEGEVETLWTEAPGLSERDRRRGKRLACQSHVLSDCRIRARLDAPGTEATRPRRVQAVLRDRRDVTGDLAEFSFHVGPDMSFRAGQYALLYLPGVAGARAYSMSHADDASGVWRFIVRRVPGGAGSGALFERLQQGESVLIDGPYGHAGLRDGERDVICVAGGSGLGPMLSVAHGVLRAPGARRVRFFLGLRSQDDLGAAHELEALRGPRLDVSVVLSQPRHGVALDGETGFVHEAVEAGLPGPPGAFDFYFAGPAPMVEAMQSLLVVRHRVPHAQVHFDRFV
jgi:toluene monooxygenase electron transfer component